MTAALAALTVAGSVAGIAVLVRADRRDRRRHAARMADLDAAYARLVKDDPT